ncbi:hypothetical protein MY8738_001205 [Beauveria namnaoensis]
MSHYSHSQSTANFRPEYPIRTTNSQQAQYERDQRDYVKVPGRDELRQSYERVEKRRAQWDKSYEEREKAYDDTVVAREERRGRNDPDIQYLRNKKNREEHALRRLDHAHRDYAAAYEKHGSDVNRIVRSRIPELSNYTSPTEVRGEIGTYSDYHKVPMLPSQREYARDRR